MAPAEAARPSFRRSRRFMGDTCKLQLRKGAGHAGNTLPALCGRRDNPFPLPEAERGRRGNTDCSLAPSRGGGGGDVFLASSLRSMGIILATREKGGKIATFGTRKVGPIKAKWDKGL